MQVCAIILNWNCRDETLTCLAALQRSTHTPEIVVVDNGSSDGSVATIRTSFPQVHVLDLAYNSGFAAGVNHGLRHPQAQQSDFVLLLNNDAEIAPDAIVRLVDAAAVYPDIGLLSAAVFYKYPSDRLWTTGHMVQPLTFSTTHSERGRRLRPTQGLRHVEFVEFCCVLLRREVFERVGLLDERFFVYYEDLDFCLRMRARGYGIACVREAWAWHSVSASTAELGPTRFYLMGRNSVLFFAKHTPRPLRPLTVFFRSYSSLRIMVQALLRNQPQLATAYLRGVATGLNDIRFSHTS